MIRASFRVMQQRRSVARMNGPVFVALGLLVAARTIPAQATIPVAEIPAATISTPTTFGGILGIRELSNSSILVNDAMRRQVSLCDALLSNCKVVIDSIAATPNSYPEHESPIIRYLGDSSLLIDVTSKSFLLIDGSGSIRRPMALPNDKNAAESLVNGGSGLDANGRILFKRYPPMEIQIVRDPAAPTGRISVKQLGEYVEVLRADLDTRSIDTVGRVRINADSLVVSTQSGGRPLVKQIVNPLPTFDEFAVMSNGVLAIVRGHDYHVDWIHSDGVTTSSSKLPFDWKSLSNDDKQHLSDSAFAARQKLAEDQKKAAATRAAANGQPAQRPARPSPSDPMPGALAEIVPLKDIADYYPPLRREAVVADLDENVWILPTTSAQSLRGELVYDVVNEKSGLFKRVRLPVGRSLAGFGKGGIVYLATGTLTTGFKLERSQLPK